ELVGKLVAGLEDRGVLGQCRAVLSGYMGDPETGRAIIGAVRKVRDAAPKALYCCDPVMGDVGRGFYVHPDIPRVFTEEVIPLADILTPNQFELEAITGIDTSSRAGARKAMEAVHRMGPEIVVVTSYKGEDTEKGCLEMLISRQDEAFRIRTPELPITSALGRMAGSGDLSSALFLARYLESGNIKTALEKATASIYGIMEATFNAGSMELLLVKAQEELVSPSSAFIAQAL
ncbi:pyridoxal kinase, partial [Treponema sp. OttesenSCG-928-L16]|nr:pyridoxal kinase [Treponema sp. OttesenSCG-928-L16]